MLKVFMTKLSAADHWGFELTNAQLPGIPQGNEQSTAVLAVQSLTEGSPADGKLYIGDIITNIAGNSTDKLSMQDVKALIDKCGNALFMSVTRQDPAAMPQGPTMRSIDEKPSTIELAADEGVKCPETSDFLDNEEKLINYSDNPEKTLNRRLETVPYEEVTPTAEEYACIPNAPELSDQAIRAHSNAYRVAASRIHPDNAKVLQEKQVYITEDQQTIPAKLLNTMSRPGMKPFTYTPRGVDLEEVMHKARTRLTNRQMQQQALEMQARDAEPSIKPKSEQPHHTRTVNEICSVFSGDAPNQPVQQSRSFHKLRGWVRQNSGDETANVPDRFAAGIDQRNKVATNANIIPSNAFRYLQNTCGGRGISNQRLPTKPVFSLSEPGEPYKISATPSSMAPYRTEENVFGRTVPARDRDRELEAHQYYGSDIPSRSFRMLEQFGGKDTNKNYGANEFPNMNQRNIRPAKDSQRAAYATNIPSRSFRHLERASGFTDTGSTGGPAHRYPATRSGYAAGVRPNPNTLPYHSDF